ncbi:MAG: amidohydrolase [Candidatus Latescibacteria bacterium]|nr:amidohydrolase [Candidatus Latescibacterota bacterium]
MKECIKQLAEEIYPKLVKIRHDIHQHPEIRFQEERTAGVVESFLDKIGVRHSRCAGTGVVAVIGSGSSHIVGIRSELDALPMPDLSGLPYASVNENACHACGHDGHIVILLGAAWVLKKLDKDIKGTVKLIWQPAEEGGAGANKMIEGGVLDSPTPEAIFGMHGWPHLPLGKAAYRFGPSMASTDDFEIVAKGKGTHGAMPHGGIDPIAISSRIVEGIQMIRSRMINPVKPLVITVGTIHGGTAVNVIPDKVVMSGTIRCIDHETRALIPNLMERMIIDTAKASGGEAEFKITAGYPPVIDEKRSTVFAQETMTEILGPENVVEIEDPVMGGEDFAFYLEKIPGTFLRLGVGDRPSLHNSSYDFNDKSIPYGVRIMTGLAVKFTETGLPE